MTVLVDVGDFKTVAVNDVFAQKVVPQPFVAMPLKPFEPADPIADHEHRLGRTPLDQLAGRRSRRQRLPVDEHRLVCRSPRCLNQ